MNFFGSSCPLDVGELPWNVSADFCPVLQIFAQTSKKRFGAKLNIGIHPSTIPNPLVVPAPSRGCARRASGTGRPRPSHFASSWALANFNDATPPGHSLISRRHPSWAPANLSLFFFPKKNRNDLHRSHSSPSGARSANFLSAFCPPGLH